MSFSKDIIETEVRMTSNQAMAQLKKLETETSGLRREAKGAQVNHWDHCLKGNTSRTGKIMKNFGAILPIAGVGLQLSRIHQNLKIL